MNFISSQRGAGLIEVMVTVLILSTSLLGLAALQNRSLQYNHSAYLRSQANILAYDLFDRIRINRENIGSYALAIDADPPTGSLLVQEDLREWRQNIASALPSGVGGINCTAARVCTVTIQWSEQDGSGVADANGLVDAGLSSFQYTTRI
ncbi:type IV pilus modification protein PilV [Microbulbifer rhizosphaerae]|uniref:Type IV pilus assembly protein PilV n=1 Tax=Microbulbifer rhizosphaerae TaxID=1562603 RepID=A0A7W4ZAN7_9GAMM|nr:type IV pilus modification protein PilV [Microbulbifer rhizosphaerae]MBB3063028.1 type IV pilus assembly protein PilV [Microbulbifer rhizosphaerae]